MRELPHDTQVWATEEYALEQPLTPARRHQHMRLAPAQRREQRKVLLAAYNELVEASKITDKPLRPPACVEGARPQQGMSVQLQQQCQQRDDFARRMAEAAACRRGLAMLGVGNCATPFEYYTAAALRDVWVQGWIAPVELKAIILLFLLADVTA
jgi:hypothetical protein